MTASPGALNLLSRLLRYPDETFERDVECAPPMLGGESPEASRLLDEFRRTLAGWSLEKRQELFIRSFDLNPVCALEVGWQLYGEEYARGRFLVSMRGLLRQYGITEVCELPDHLSHFLPLLDRMPPEESRRLVTRALLPALEKMLEALKRKQNPYQNVLRAIRELARLRFAPELQEAGHA